MFDVDLLSLFSSVNPLHTTSGTCTREKCTRKYAETAKCHKKNFRYLFCLLAVSSVPLFRIYIGVSGQKLMNLAVMNIISVTISGVCQFCGSYFYNLKRSNRI